jgi:hypothetical protein
VQLLMQLLCNYCCSDNCCIIAATNAVVSSVVVSIAMVSAAGAYAMLMYNSCCSCTADVHLLVLKFLCS